MTTTPETMTLDKLARLIDGMFDTVACRSEVAECIDPDDTKALDAFAAETRRMVEELHRSIAIFDERNDALKRARLTDAH